jgi:hypothetical protein
VAMNDKREVRLSLNLAGRTDGSSAVFMLFFCKMQLSLQKV